MISKFSSSIKGKLGTVFIIFNIMFAVCNIVIYLYMAANYCDAEILTLPIASLFFGCLNLFLLTKQMAWNSISLHFSLILSIAILVTSIAGTVICSQFIFCKLILCAKGIDEREVLSDYLSSRSEKNCPHLSQDQEEQQITYYYHAKGVENTTIVAAWPISFGIIQIVICFLQCILTYSSLYKFTCPPKKDVKGLEMYD